MLTSMPLTDAAITALLGYAVVFFGLILLMLVIIVISRFFVSAKKASVAEPVPAEPAPQPVAPGAAGGVKLYNVDEKTAAMLMAIVADKLQKPLNELRFISVKEVEQ